MSNLDQNAAAGNPLIERPDYHVREAMKAEGRKLASSPELRQQVDGVVMVIEGHWQRAADYDERRHRKAMSFEKYTQSYLDQIRQNPTSCLAQSLAGPGLERLLKVTPTPKRNLLEGTYRAERRRRD